MAVPVKHRSQLSGLPLGRHGNPLATTERSMVKQERAARTRETLIRSAAEVFDREGFSRASLTAISSLAGVSNGALHFHFASKAALADVVEATALTKLLALTHTQPPAGKASHVQLVVDVTHRLAHALRDDVVLRTGFALGGEPSRPVRVGLREHWRCWVAQALERAEAEGELRTEVAPQDVVTAVVAATAGFEVLGVRDAMWLSATTVSRFWRLLLPAVAPAALLTGLQAGGTRPQ
ncbi:ScbR family autoregulator-binding transcription factor [Streptomyces sp. NPDC059851]|uniref:ScbR family autoregulator-binding transcription factor n=1 Tax=Streptomyces sp. NPDC059851 TaxID=3346971 RepID=UPI00365412F6